MASQFEQQIDPEWLDIMRQRRMAEMLNMQSQEPLHAPSYGGVASTISPWQGLAQMAKAGVGGWMGNKADEKQKMYADKLKTQDKTDMEAFMGAIRGKPQSTAPYESDNVFGEDLGDLKTVTQPAVAPDRDKAMGVAMGSRSPVLQGAGTALLADMLKGQTPDNPYAKVDPKDYTPESIARFNQSRNYGDLVPTAGVAKPQLVTVWENGKPVQKWVTPGQANGVMVGEGKPENQSDIARLMAEMNQLPPGDPRRQVYENAIKKATTHQPAAQMNNYGTSFTPAIDAATQKPVLLQPSKYGGKPNVVEGYVPSDDAEKGRQAISSANAKTVKLQLFKDDIERLEQLPGLDSATGINSLIPAIPGSEKADAVTAIEQIADKSAGAAIQEMRDLSKTGGAVGQVSEKEWPKLESQLANVKRSQSDASFRENLQRLKTQIDTSIRLLEDAAMSDANATGQKFTPSGGPQDGQRSKSKSGKPIIYRNGRWEYE